MWFRARSCAIPLMVSLTLVVACGSDDDGMGPGDGGNTGDLTQQESVEMMEALAAVGSFAFFPTGGGAAAAPSATPVNYTFDQTESCPAGGSVRFQGSLDGDVDQQTGSADFNITMTQTHTDCVGSSDSGKSFTFNGSPNITTSMDLMTDQSGSGSIHGTQQGTLSWTTGGKSGSCTIDVTYDFSSSGTSASGSVSGTVCGYSISQNISA